jgi:lipopolysaccharide assembly outer membrane protein LptD (OstA)
VKIRIFFILSLVFFQHTFAQTDAKKITGKTIDIEADSIKFETANGLNKTKASGNVIIHDSENLITAQNLEVAKLQDGKETNMSLSGGVILDALQGTLKTEQMDVKSADLKYFKTNGQAKMFFKEYNAHLQITNPEGDTQFNQVKGQNITSDSLLKGYAATINLNAKSMEKNGTNYLLEGGKFSSCDLDCNPFLIPWMVKSSKIKYDQSTNTVMAKHTFFKIFGVPVFYLPYYKKNLNPKAVNISPPLLIFLPYQTGFAPSVLITPLTVKNFSLKLSPTFYLNESTNPGALARSLISSQKGASITLTEQQKKIFYRQHTLGVETGYKKRDKLHIYLNSLYTQDYVFEDYRNALSETKQSRYFVNTDLSYLPSDNFSLGLHRWDISDRFFSLKYGGFFGNYLKSTADVNYTDKSNYLLNLAQASYQPIATYVPSTQLSTITPNINFRYDYKDKITTQTSFVSVNRERGERYDRLLELLDLNLFKKITSYGQLFEFNTRLQMDSYRYRDAQNISKTYARLVPYFNFNTTFPLQKRTKTANYLIEPRISIYHTSYTNRSNFPNLDSGVGFVNDFNLFTYSRFSGTDLVEEGTRAVYGVNFTASTKNNWLTRAFVGRVENFGQNKTQQLLLSDYIGTMMLNSGKFTYSSKFLYNSVLGEYNLFLNTINYRPLEWLGLRLESFVLNKTLIQNPASKADIDNLSPGITLNFTKNYALSVGAVSTLVAQTNPDGKVVKSRQLTQTNFNLSYDSKCALINLGYVYNTLVVQNSGTPRGQFLFNFLLKGM